MKNRDPFRPDSSRNTHEYDRRRRRPPPHTRLPHLSNIKYRISIIKYDVKYQISNIKHQISHIKYQALNILMREFPAFQSAYANYYVRGRTLIILIHTFSYLPVGLMPVSSSSCCLVVRATAVICSSLARMLFFLQPFISDLASRSSEHHRFF